MEPSQENVCPFSMRACMMGESARCTFSAEYACRSHNSGTLHVQVTGKIRANKTKGICRNE